MADSAVHDDPILQEGDCRVVAADWPAGSVDLIVADPPYGIGGDRLDQHYNRDGAFVVDGYVEVPAGEYAEFSREWIAAAARVLRPGGALFVVSGYTHLAEVLLALRAAGLEERNHIIWQYNFGVYTRRKFVSSHYHILYWVKPGGPVTFNLESRFGGDERDDAGGSLNYQDRVDVWRIDRAYQPGQQKNQNELPQALLQKIIQYASDPGDTVADFFVGGGSTGRVAIGLGRGFRGIELSPSAFAHAARRLAGVVPGDLLAGLRVPPASQATRRGAAWSDEERVRLAERYAALRAEGLGKGAAIERLQGEFERGRFAILNAVNRATAAGPR